MMAVVGIDLGGTFIKAGLVDPRLGLIRSVSRPSEASRGPEHVLDGIAAAIGELAQGAPLEGVGIGSPGAVNLARTSVSLPPNFPGWSTYNLAESIQKRIGRHVPVLVDNDANVAALGSAHYGAGKPFDDFIMVTLGTGVGGAIIIGKKLFRGSTGAAGEIGHMSIDYEGPVPRSGVPGAIEAYLGQRFLSRHARDRLIARPRSRVHELAGDELEHLTPELLYQAASQGDESAIEVFAWAGHKLGCVLGSAVNLLDIRKVVVGGGISAAGDLLLDPARVALLHQVTPALRGGVEIIREVSGNDIAQLGAARLVLDELS